MLAIWFGEGRWRCESVELVADDDFLKSLDRTRRRPLCVVEVAIARRESGAGDRRPWPRHRGGPGTVRALPPGGARRRRHTGEPRPRPKQPGGARLAPATRGGPVHRPDGIRPRRASLDRRVLRTAPSPRLVF